jgi:hypothetical protein
MCGLRATIAWYPSPSLCRVSAKAQAYPPATRLASYTNTTFPYRLSRPAHQASGLLFQPLTLALLLRKSSAHDAMLMSEVPQQVIKVMWTPILAAGMCLQFLAEEVESLDRA